METKNFTMGQPGSSVTEIILQLINMLYIRIMLLIQDMMNFKGLKPSDMVKILIFTIIIGMFYIGFNLIIQHFSISKTKLA